MSDPSTPGQSWQADYSLASIAAMPKSVASEIERRFSRINASLLESTVTITRGLFLFAAVGLAVFFSCPHTFLLPCMAGACYCPHIEARTTFDTNDTMKTSTETNRLSFLYATKLGLFLKAGDVVVVRLRADQKSEVGFVRDGRSYSNIKTARRYRDGRPDSARMFEIMGRVGNTWAVQEIA